MQPIDPVVVREKLERTERLASRQATAKRALVGLGWFAEYAFGNTTVYEGGPDGHPVAGTGVRQVDPAALAPSTGLGGPKAPQLIVASSTPGVEAAAHYVKVAYEEARKGILERAIALAQADLLANEVTENSSGR